MVALLDVDRTARSAVAAANGTAAPLSPPAPASRIYQAGEARLASMESLRALAAVAVVSSHVFRAALHYSPAVYDGLLHRTLVGGGEGVFLFFALSGYLLYLPFARRDFGLGRDIRLGRYAVNRAVRILPLYYVVLVVLLLAMEHGGTGKQWGLFSLFAENFSHQTVGTVDTPMWSLVVELHFYLLLPVLALAIRVVARRSIARAGVALATLTLGSLALRVATVTGPVHPHFPWQYSLPTTFLFFAAGLALALLRVRWDGAPPGWLTGPLRRGDVWLLASVPLWLATLSRPDVDVVAAAASFLVVGSAGLPLRRGRLVQCLDWRPLALLGTASYSLYLWHVPIVQEVSSAGWSPAGFLPLLAILLPICIVVAVVSYAAIEEPFLRLRRSWSGRYRPLPAPAVTSAVTTT
jgi:peptidoglycan/LPS O-acetylase OafA/YrhL